MASRLWVAEHDRLGWVDPLGRRQALCRGSNGRGPDRMMRGCFRVSPKGTDVMGMVAAQGLPLGRCLGVAESSLSLSLSLLTPCFLAKHATGAALCGAAAAQS